MNTFEKAELDSKIPRRELLKALGGGILVLTVIPSALASLQVERGGGPSGPQQISAWVHISETGAITIFTGKVEVGQNARTSITQAAAEELRVSPHTISVVMGDTDLVPFDMGTFGSMTTPRMLPVIRKAAAAARELLLDLAAEKSKLSRGILQIQDGKISSGAFSATYGDLARGKALDKAIPVDIETTPPPAWKTMGTSLPKVGAKEIVTGRHLYASDIRRPDMLYGKVLRPPSFGAKLTSVDGSAAEAMGGVHVIHDGDFVAVVAPTLRGATKALTAVKAVWDEQKHPNHADLFTIIRGTDALPSVAKGEKTLTGTYRCEYIAHVPLEPRAGFAEWIGTRLTVYTGTQRPFAVKDEVVKATGLAPRHVRVIVPDTGSGYGGKHTGEAAVEAARIAKVAQKPVRVVWTRQEELTWSYFRPAGQVEISSGFSAQGKLTDWTHDNYNSGPSAIETPYAVESKRSNYHEAKSPLRQGSYRSLAACFNNFARETHMDELAHATGQDPLTFRLANISDPRLSAVLQAVADKFGWTAKPGAGHGFGIACGADKGGYVAVAVELSVQDKEITLLRAVIGYDCGAVVNPDLLKNQVVGGMIMGIGGALFEAVDFADGKILTDHLYKYRVPRYADIPHIECVLIDRKDVPSAGAGETPIIGIAPAIGNAIFSATGTRLRSMPLKLE